MEKHQPVNDDERRHRAGGDPCDLFSGPIFLSGYGPFHVGEPASRARRLQLPRGREQSRRILQSRWLCRRLGFGILLPHVIHAARRA
jgi:hypothetical protein